MTSCTIIKCDLTAVTTVVPGTGKDTIYPSITKLDTRVERHYGLRIRQIRSDNERALGNRFPAWCDRKGIDWLPSAIDTAAQNGGAERAGGVIIRISTSIRIAARLPEDYWPESTVTAAYLHNLMPTETNGWKSPLVTLKEAIGDISSIPVPSYGHLKAYSCRAYLLTTKVKRGKERKRKLKPRAHIGYLVGYDSTNIFRIWVPALSKVIRTRDVTFNEDLFFDPKSEDLTAQLVAELKPLV